MYCILDYFPLLNYELLLFNGSQAYSIVMLSWTPVINSTIALTTSIKVVPSPIKLTGMTKFSAEVHILYYTKYHLNATISNCAGSHSILVTFGKH